MSKAWPLVPLGEVLTERQEVPPDDALASGQIRIVSKVGFNDGRIQLRADGQTKTGMILIRPGDLVVSGTTLPKVLLRCTEKRILNRLRRRFIMVHTFPTRNESMSGIYGGFCGAGRSVTCSWNLYQEESRPS